MKQTYFVYLDEFGHIGPYVARNHPQYNTFPVFGFGGIVIPADQVRGFSSWFYKLKCNLLSFEINRDGIPSFRWEKKGAALYTTQNVLRYKELRQATFRMLNKIHNVGGFVFYVGMEKNAVPGDHLPNHMMFSVLRAAIRKLDQFCVEKDANFVVFLDHREEKVLREAVVGVTQQEMYGQNPKRTLLEAPTQVESHLYQAMQAADWMCGLIGRLESFRTRPDEYQDWSWSEKYFGQRIKAVSIRSGVRKQTSILSAPPPPETKDSQEEREDKAVQVGKAEEIGEA